MLVFVAGLRRVKPSLLFFSKLNTPEKSGVFLLFKQFY
nr:MAG TPA: hypothetical protein [Caudoviricetes sp.]